MTEVQENNVENVRDIVQIRARLKEISDEITRLMRERAQLEKILSESEGKSGSGKSKFKREFKAEDKTILIVDDVKIMRIVLQRILMGAGYKVIEADGPTAAFSVLAEQDVNLMIVDINMPEMTGLQMTEEIFNKKSKGSIPVIVVTSETDPDFIIEASRLGVKEYIRKPVESKLILEKVARVFAEQDE